MPEVIVSWGALILVGVGLAILIVAISVRAKRQRKHRQEKGLQWLTCLRSLLSHIQKHRGKTTGYLNGGSHLMGEIEGLQRSVSRDFSSVVSIDDGIDANSRWCGITQHWARLAGNFTGHSPEHNLSQHNMLIKNVLYLIDDLAQECDLLLLKNKKDKPLHLYWRELLSAAEYIGQARAIGVGVSTAAHCDSVSRIRLNYLCQQIEGNTEKLWREIGKDPTQATQVKELLGCIKDKLVLDTPSIPPGEFFNIATEALDSLLDQFDRLVKEQQWV
ncbi:MAG: hypothetical protein CL693_04705 [Cellvibrionaceae bacterium]|nr:hypothetical protein [Cellvibrionaceae bacterium]|tara:strand:- start:1462 stop:2283 length:822 start_codon:yes stop_codon:yes gene_type:complete